MVLVDGVKFACSACIRGHRSSKCNHTTRTLVEIKKKGRPTSQCSHCRDLRKTRAVHGRCDCAARETEERPKAMVLANGLQDIATADSPAVESPDGIAEGRQEHRELTCTCQDGGSCHCCKILSRSAKGPSPPDQVDSVPSPAGSFYAPTPAATPISFIPVPFPQHQLQQPNQLFYFAAASAPFDPYQQQYIPFASTSQLPYGYAQPIQPQQQQFYPTAAPHPSHFYSSALAAPSFPSPVLNFSMPPPTLPQYSNTFPTASSYCSSPAASAFSTFAPSTPGTSVVSCGEKCTCGSCSHYEPTGYRGGLSTAGSNDSGVLTCPCDAGQQAAGALTGCCGGAAGQLQAAQAAGMSMEELMKTMVQGCAMNLPPLDLGTLQEQPTRSGPLDLAASTSVDLPPLSQIWATEAPPNAPDRLQEQSTHRSWSEEAPKRKASGSDSPELSDSGARTPTAPQWTGGIALSYSSAPSPQAGPSSMLSLDFDGMNLATPGKDCSNNCSCIGRCACTRDSEERGTAERGAEGDIEEMVLAAPPCRGMKMKARVRPEGASTYSTRPSRRRKVHSPLAIEILPPPAPSESSLAPTSPPATAIEPSHYPMPSIFDDFPLNFGQLGEGDNETFTQPYEESAADTLAATGRVLESPMTSFLRLGELESVEF